MIFLRARIGGDNAHANARTQRIREIRKWKFLPYGQAAGGDCLRRRRRLRAPDAASRDGDEDDGRNERAPH